MITKSVISYGTWACETVLAKPMESSQFNAMGLIIIFFLVWNKKMLWVVWQIEPPFKWVNNDNVNFPKHVDLYSDPRELIHSG